MFVFFEPTPSYFPFVFVNYFQITNLLGGQYSFAGFPFSQICVHYTSACSSNIPMQHQTEFHYLSFSGPLLFCMNGEISY